MENLCHRQHRKLHVRLFERNYVPEKLRYFQTLHINAAFKQKNVRLLAAFFRRAIWPSRSQWHVWRRPVSQFL